MVLTRCPVTISTEVTLPPTEYWFALQAALERYISKSALDEMSPFEKRLYCYLHVRFLLRVRFQSFVGIE